LWSTEYLLVQAKVVVTADEWQNGGLRHITTAVPGRRGKYSIREQKAMVAKTPKQGIDKLALTGSMANDSDLRTAIQTSVGSMHRSNYGTSQFHDAVPSPRTFYRGSTYCRYTRYCGIELAVYYEGMP